MYIIHMAATFLADAVTSYAEACRRLGSDTNLELSSELAPIIDTQLLP